MWFQIFKFEIKYRIKRLDTYIFFIFLFLFSIIAVDFIYESVELGKIKDNAPIVIAKTMGAITGITMMVASMIMGVPILRDFEHEMESLMFINPIKKKDYLLGRFLGSFAVLIFVYSGLIWGNILGEFMPWRSPEDLISFKFITYLQPFFTVVTPILFFGAALFFVSGTLSRKLIVVYTQGLFVFVLFMLTRGIENKFIGAILDPFSLTTLSVMTDTWDANKLNSTQIPFNSVLLYSKMFWVFIGITILWIGYKKFNYNLIKSTKHKKKKEILESINNVIDIELPEFNIQNTYKAKCLQLIQLTLFYIRSILKEVSFWAIVGCAMVIIIINSISLGTIYGVDSHPATYFIVEELLEMSGYFFIIILVFYSGELIWKERGIKIDLIYDALPSNDIINVLAKFLGLNVIYIILMLSVIIAGIIFQGLNGYYEFEISNYAVSFFGDFLPFLSFFTVISFVIHILINRKFVAYIVVLAILVCGAAMPLLGFKHNLYNFGGGNLGVYSQMNGYGPFVKSYLWFKTYWSIFCSILFVISTLFIVRGTDTDFIQRFKKSRKKLSRPVQQFLLVATVVFLCIGSYIYYNTNILNSYWSQSQQKEFRAGYEKTLKKYEYKTQPKIVDINLELELYPNDRDYTVKGTYTLKNKSENVINEIHIQKLIDDQTTLKEILFDKEVVVDSLHHKYDYYIYKLKTPLEPKETIKMFFKQNYSTIGFENDESNTKIVQNGSFLTNADFPSLGYNKKYELKNDIDREAYNLTKRKGKALKTDVNEIKNAISGDDGYHINFEIVIGTTLDQIAVAPGTLKKQWRANNRSYFHYKMKEPMINFYAIVSAKYETLKSTWNNANNEKSSTVDLEIYYHKGHEYNLDRMMESMKMSLSYFSKNFSLYPYKEMRIMEFPRYAEFAQSFPATIPFSEALGFMLDIDDETDVDMAFYITAHEVAHQWWGLQVVAANVQGRQMILETLAQYSALMVLKQKYSEEKVQQFLREELDAYLKGRLKESQNELSLSLVENQDYIYYSKGAINMYALQERIGETAVNTALQKFVSDWNAFGEGFEKKRYAISDDLLSYFKRETPDSLQYVIKDLFETVTIYDNKIVEVEKNKLADNTYKVTMTIEIDKSQYNDSEIDEVRNFNEWIDVEVYGKDEKLFYKEYKVGNKKETIEILLEKEPMQVTIDPLLKLIDSDISNNTKKILKEND